MKRLVIELTDETHAQLKMRALIENKSMRDLVMKEINKLLRRKK